jgi:hypothetical protein
VKTKELPKYVDGCILECNMKKMYKCQGYTKTLVWEFN